MTRKWVVISSVLWLSFTLTSSQALGTAACPFHEWIDYRGIEVKKHSVRSAYYYVTSHKAVDADGAPNAYHSADVGKPCAPAGIGLDCPANAGYPNASWWRNVLVPDPDDESVAYIQENGAFKGYFVSKTALSARGKSETDPVRYVDARNFPYVVFPGKFYQTKGTGLLGDLGIAYHLKSGKRVPFIVADIGPRNAQLGEASIALFARFGGRSPNPRTGEGIPEGKVLYLFFPYSKRARSVSWPITNNEIELQAAALLDAVGGDTIFENCR